jgi:hypothetical protein
VLQSICTHDESHIPYNRCTSFFSSFRLLRPAKCGGKRQQRTLQRRPGVDSNDDKDQAGLADEYLKQITGSVKPVYDEEKKQKIILDYKILNGEASGPQDFNILILVEYPNWAAFDNLRDKMDPIVEKVMGTEDQRRTTAVKRLDIREIIGTKTMREITLK